MEPWLSIMGTVVTLTSFNLKNAWPWVRIQPSMIQKYDTVHECRLVFFLSGYKIDHRCHGTEHYQ